MLGGGALEGGRAEFRKLGCSWTGNACLMPSKAATRAANARIEACAAGGVLSQMSGGNAAALSMATGYATYSRHRNHEVFTS
jgi:hypothetical protein